MVVATAGLVFVGALVEELEVVGLWVETVGFGVPDVLLVIVRCDQQVQILGSIAATYEPEHTLLQMKWLMPSSNQPKHSPREQYWAWPRGHSPTHRPILPRQPLTLPRSMLIFSSILTSVRIHPDFVLVGTLMTADSTFCLKRGPQVDPEMGNIVFELALYSVVGNIVAVVPRSRARGGLAGL